VAGIVYRKHLKIKCYAESTHMQPTVQVSFL